MSKNAFKRAVGRLLKEGKICLEKGRISKRETVPEETKEEKKPKKTGRTNDDKGLGKAKGLRRDEKAERTSVSG